MICLAHAADEVATGKYFSLPEIHPALNHFPIAFLIGGVILDLYAWWRQQENLQRIATALMLAGIIMGLVTAAAGFLAFFTVSAHTETAHVLMYWHLGIQAASILIFAIVVRRRWNTFGSPLGSSRALEILAAVGLLVGSYIGGFIVYQGGAGVDPQILSAEVREHHHHGGGHPGDEEHHEHSTEHTHAPNSDSSGR